MGLQLQSVGKNKNDAIILKSELPSAKIWPIAGGKGGTGKSTLTANVGVGLSLLGYKVILVDGDLGGADLHLFFDQISPSRNLCSFLSKDVKSLKDTLLPTPNENLRIVCGGNELVGMANLSYMTKAKLIRHTRALDADFVLIDLGAGSAYNTIDLFTLSNDGIIVCTPEPQARLDAYCFIKNTVYRKLRQLFGKDEELKDLLGKFSRNQGKKSGKIIELLSSIGQIRPQIAEQASGMLRGYQPKLILNRVRTKRHIEDVNRFVSLVSEYLATEISYVGYVRNDESILDACERRRPVLLESPKCSASTDLYKVLLDGLKIPDRLHRFQEGQSRRFSQITKAEAKLW